MITRRVLTTRQLAVFTSQPPISNGRPFSTSPTRQNAASKSPTQSAKPHTIDPKWLTVMKRRIGKCMTFGLRPDQVQEAGSVLQQLARDWRELIAGSEGYLTDEKRRGLFRHNVVWGEMDIMVRRHVNNVTYVRYAETARINWSRNLGIHIDPAHKKEWLNILNSTGIGLILKSIKVDYKFPMVWPDKISVYHKLVQNQSSDSTPKSSFELQVMIVSEAHQRPAARCYEDIVTYDYKQGRKTQTLPPFMIDQFKVIWKLQEEAKRKCQQQILDIENRVRLLELGSWDREGAVEDMGSAAKR